MLNSPGPRTIFFPEFPYCPVAFGWNAAVLNQWFNVRALPLKFGSPVTLARWLLVPVNALSRPLVIDTESPLINLTIVENCHPLAVLRSQVEWNVGEFNTAELMKACL